MRPSTYLPLVLCVSCGTSSRPDLAHLETVLSAQQIQRLRTEAGLTDTQLAQMTVAQADKRIRKLAKPTQSTPGDAFEWRRRTMVLEDGTIPDDALTKAIAHRDRMVKTDFDTGGIQQGSWSWIGPGFVGGRCRSLAITTNGVSLRTLVLGSVGGGVWRSNDSGASWAPVADYPASLAVGCMEAGGNEIWLGTGEGFGNGDSIRGAGIYYSKDFGSTFERLRSTANQSFYYVNRIAVRRGGSASTLILAATRTGLWRSPDSGVTWRRVVTGNMLDVKIMGTNAACAGNTPGSVRYSTDSGVNWRAATGLPSTARRVELATTRRFPNVVFASVEIAGGNSRVYRSTNGGASYSLRNASGLLGNQGWYDNAIWIDPTNPNIIVVGGIRLYRSINGGGTFTDITGIHVDQHRIVADPGYNGTTNRIVYVCNDGGIYRTNDIYTASRTSGWTNLNNRIGITQFYGGAVSATGRVFGGTQDNGTQQILSTTTKAARMIRGADGGQCEADPIDTRYLYGETQYAGVFRSTNGGVSTESIVSNMTDTGKGKAPWIGALRLDPNNPNRLWLGSKRLWRTDNVKISSPNGVFWRLVRSTDEYYSSIDVMQGNSNLVVAVEDNGSVFRSTNATAVSPTWSKIDRGGLPNRYASTVRFNPRNSNHIYVAFGGFASRNVWETRNSGATWQSISGSGATGLPAAPVRALAVHPQNEGWLYVGTEVGIFASTDGGATWSTNNEGPATVSVDEIVVRSNDKIYAFTHGRGIYVGHAGTNRDAPARTSRASLTWLDAQARGHSYHSTISGNGRYVAFASDSTDLYPLDTNGRRDIFLRDRQSGETTRESISTASRQSLGHSDYPDISENGRFIAFQSDAGNLVSGDTNGRRDIFLRDRELGTTERASLMNASQQTPIQGNGHSDTASISADGRYVVFNTLASNFGVSNGPGSDVFRYDRIKKIIQHMSIGGNGPSYCTRQAVAGDGSRTVFSSMATNFRSTGSDTNGKSDIYMVDRPVASFFHRISVSSTGALANGHSYQPSISSDGRYIVFQSHATNLVAGDTNGKADIFLHDFTTKTTTRVSVTRTGAQANGDSEDPMISADGSTITFRSAATNLVSGDTNRLHDIFVRQRTSASSITRANVDEAGRQGTGGTSYHGYPSSDGKFITYWSGARNLVSNDTNGAFDVFVYEQGIASTALPTSVTNTAGSTSTPYPLGSSDLRLQQSARETLGRTMSIKRIAFRRDDRGTNTSASQRTIDVSLMMGNCFIDNLKPAFYTNWNGIPSTVITRKQFNLPDWRSVPNGLAKFDASWPLDRAYVHTGARHLLWEARVYDNSRPSSLAIVDAHGGYSTVVSSTSSTGAGCKTPNGRFSHSLTVSSNGPSTTYRVTATRGPSNASLVLALGAANPNLTLPGLCTKIYVTPLLQTGIGATNKSGAYATTFQAAAWDPTWKGLVLHSQLYTPAGGYLTGGVRTAMPNVDPGPWMRRVFAGRTASSGTVQDLGAVFKLDY